MDKTGGAVEVRAFRGTRRTSVYREHVLSERDFERILAAGAARGLSLFASLEPHGTHELEKADAKRLADETTDVRGAADLPDLDHDLVAIAELARWCARASGPAWLKIGVR
jgi:hypothetical protein